MNYRRQGGFLQFEEDTFTKNAETRGKFFHEVSILMNFYRLSRKLRVWK